MDGALRLFLYRRRFFEDTNKSVITFVNSTERVWNSKGPSWAIVAVVAVETVKTVLACCSMV